jgi:hypothetical protein
MTTDEAICIGNFIEAMEKLHKPIVIRMCWLDVSELQTSAALIWMEEPQDDDSCSTGKSVGKKMKKKIAHNGWVLAKLPNRKLN